jgi:cytochrome c-type biogenesis protein CcmH
MARLLCLALAAVALFPASASAQVNISDVEDEVMCPICGTLLELSDSPQARREKAFIAEMIAAGKSKAEIKDALVDEYGAEVLAQPKGSGFELSAYLVPAIALLVAAVALAVGIARWRRRGGDGGGTPAAGDGPADEDSARLDADIARYDL